MLPGGIGVDVRILRRVGRMADIRTGLTPIPATVGSASDIAQSLSISRVMRDSSRKFLRDG